MDALLAKLREGSVMWLMHVNADPDCVGAAFALREAFGGTAAASEGLSKNGARLARRLDFVVDEWPHPEQFATLVTVDTSSRSQLGRLATRVGNPSIVDHHEYGDLQAHAPAKAWDATRSSCCEVVLALLDRSGAQPTPRGAFALLAGLVDDSQRFRHSDAATLVAASRLVELSQTSVGDVAAFLEAEDDDEDSTSKRTATLKAAQRSTLEDVHGMLVATSEVGSFDAAAAGALVRAGADLALVTATKSDRARISMRASRRLGLNLGEVANTAAREVGWSGGGHEGAAGLSGKPPAEPAVGAVMRLVREKLGAR